VVGQIGVAAAKTLGGSIAVGAISGAAAGFVGAGLSFGKNWEPQFDMDKAFTGAAIGGAVGGAFAAAGYGIGKGVGNILIRSRFAFIQLYWFQMSYTCNSRN